MAYRRENLIYRLTNLYATRASSPLCERTYLRDRNGRDQGYTRAGRVQVLIQRSDWRRAYTMLSLMVVARRRIIVFAVSIAEWETCTIISAVRLRGTVLLL